MKELDIKYTIKVYENPDELKQEDRQLVEAAKKATGDAYTPYSGFNVGCSLRLDNGEMLTGSNQENASFPAGLCAERVTLSAASALFPGVGIQKMAVAVSGEGIDEDKPVAPCGICRQTIFEYEKRFNSEISILLAAGNGMIYELGSIQGILPLGFSSEDLP